MASSSLMHAKFAVGIIGNIATLSTSFSPIPTFWKIWKKGTTGDFSVLPYAMTFACNLFWAWYALPFVTVDNLPLLIISLVQVVLQSLYILIYSVFAIRYQKLNVLLFMVMICLVFTLEAVLTLRVLHGSTRKLFAGLVSTIAAVITFASPLSVMGLVIKTRSVEYMPVLVSLSFLFNCTTWGIYGIMGKDIYLIIAEALGTTLAVLQILLFVVYYHANPLIHSEEQASEPKDEQQELPKELQQV